ncbi:hypothetical protein LTR85_000630 [Meristemomyces frigidus]|nr:hypothetical protein LTR85_000630 [Meristemomyces frigidus]
MSAKSSRPGEKGDASVRVSSMSDQEDNRENHPIPHEQRGSGRARKTGAIQRWTPTALLMSYFVFSIALYTILSDHSRKVFWFLYLAIATIVAGTTALEAYDGLTPLREARKAVAKADGDGWTFKTADEALPTLNLIFDFGDEEIPQDVRPITHLPEELMYPDHKVVVNILRKANGPSAAMDYIGHEKPSSAKVITIPTYAAASLSARVGYCLALDAPNTASSITAVFSGAQRPHPHAVRHAVERLLQDKKVDIVQGRNILVPRGGFFSRMSTLGNDMFSALLYPGRSVTWSLSVAQDTNSYWRTDALHAAVTASATVACDGMDLGFTAVARKARTAYDLKIISYAPGPTTVAQFWALQVHVARELAVATTRYSGLAFMRQKGEKSDAGNKWTLKTRFAVLWTLPIMRFVSHAIVQYFCMAWAILFTSAPNSTADFARTIYFPYPISIWLIVSGTIVQSLAQNATAGFATAPSNATAGCHCGYIDPSTSLVYTDSVIVYFNETNTVPKDVFSIDTFKHSSEKGWFIYYREGAVEENVKFEEGSVWNLDPGWLDLNVSGYTPEHLVNGAQLQTVRQDIKYGTFRAFMRSPQPYAGGSALTMRLQYNETSSVELDLLNMDDSTDDACMQTSVSNQDPVTSWGLNYTVLEEPQYNVGPWDFWEWRMDWSEKEIDWFVGENKTRTVPTTNASLVDVPTAFYLKHWSNGDASFMQGPPTNTSAASIGWVRLFFNSSVESTSQINSSSCDASQLCSTEDTTLRLSTGYNAESTVRWTPESTHKHRSKTVGLALIAASLAFSAALLIHALIRKWSDKKAANRTGVPVGTQRPKMPTSPWPSQDMLSKSRATSGAWTSQADLEMHDLKTHHVGASSTTLLAAEPAFLGRHERSMSQRPLLNTYDSTAASSQTAFTAGQMTPGTNPFDTPGFDRRSSYFGAAKDMNISPAASRNNFGSPATPAEASTTDLLLKGAALPPGEPEGSAAAANPGAKPTPVLPQARTRVDYLAGLVACCSLLVSCTHFILTFVPSVIEEYLPQHYESEYWARRTIEPFFFNEIWVGIFFTTSTRFLTSGFIRTGNLKIVAEKVVCRCPRLMIPITAVIIFQYFCMDLGAVKYLEYIPSISWSTWPSTTLYTNFGFFVDETLQLFYLIPNAAPQITWNYCTGVLWTIPVQLQFTWVVLLGAVVIREIKTPWKRFGFYAFVIINNWYAMSWGYYFYGGLLLADLDITYKYRKWIQARAYVHYPMLCLAIALVFLSLGNDLFAIWTGWTFSTQERGIHPEVESGLNIGATSDAGYPAYTEPKLNGFVFAVASQYVVELSTWVQAVLSTRVFLLLFPHVFTIYLIHGLIFWSVGTVVCVYFAHVGLAYWLNMLLTALCCYATLFACLPIVTPVMEMLGKEITKGIWVSASEEPPPWRPSSYPFSVEDIRGMVYRKDDDESFGGGKGKGRVGTGMSSGREGS